MKVLNFTVDIDEQYNCDDDSRKVYVVLSCNNQEVWRDDGLDHVDTYGYDNGMQDAEYIAIRHLRRAFNV